MKKQIRYIYFRLYRYFDHDRAIPSISIFCVIFAMILLMVFGLLNLVTIFDGKERLILSDVKPGTIGYLWSLLFFIPLYLVFNYFIKRNRLHDSIIAEFEDESEIARRKSRILTLTIVIFPLVFFFVTLYLRG